MPLTRSFKEAGIDRARRDPTFREELLAEAIECFLAGDVGAGKIILRDYINATIGFKELARATGKKDTSLMRMLGPKGNPAACNLFALVAQLQRRERTRLHVTPVR
ncbi:MAG: transcriptional regulator [Alphaproteobacteria bacterium]|nr:transcriptional regulator [Alphaproteobacteria bacterium]